MPLPIQKDEEWLEPISKSGLWREFGCAKAAFVDMLSIFGLHVDKYFGPNAPWENCTIPKPNVDASLLGGGKYCSPGCKPEWLGDGVCDLACNVCTSPEVGTK